MSGDDERPRRSWREIDQMRDGTRSRDQGPRGHKAQERAREASKEYLKQIDGLFTSEQGGAEGADLAKAMREAHGTPGLADACRAYRDAIGLPGDPSLLSLFLDTGEEELVIAALGEMRVGRREGRLESTSGLRSQVGILAEDFNNAIAEIAEELLDEL